METTEEIQQSLISSSEPAQELLSLSRSNRLRVFFQLPDPLREVIVDEMNRDQLQEFVRRLDPEEATDVLGFFIFLWLEKVVL